MDQSTRPPANRFVAAMRKLYNPLGFSKGYNFILWFITIGYIMGFTLARLEYFSYYGIFCNPNNTGALGGAAPGECFYYLRNPYKVGMMLHLFCILPAAFLVCFQFVPAIRHKIILFHRINGYLVILLCLIASAGALIAAEYAFGGDLATRSWVGALVISTTLAYSFAWVNIKRLQIDQHRAWMMRAWAYFSTVITLRLILFASSAIISSIGNFFTSVPCDKIDSVIGPDYTLALYPGCAPFFQGKNAGQEVVVEANYNQNIDPIAVTAALDISFGAAGWLAWWIHAIVIEVYLRLTPAESERLCQVSYQRQLERGFKNPGAAGLVAQRLGDANPYIPPQDISNIQQERNVLSPDGGKRTNVEEEH